MAKETNERSNWVDIRDKALMIELGIHPRDVEPRDPSVWTKTDKQKKELKKLRIRNRNVYLSKSPYEKKRIPVYGKLIINIIGKNIEKTTFSCQCGQSDIPNILNRFTDEHGKSIVRHYKWIGKTYGPNELPFWYW